MDPQGEGSWQTVIIARGIVWLVCLIILLLAGGVALYFYHYGLPPPFGKKKVEVRKKEVVVEKPVVVKRRPKGSKVGKSWEPGMVDYWEGIPLDVIFDAKLEEIVLREVVGETVCDIHIKLTRAASNEEEAKWKQLKLVVTDREKEDIKIAQCKLRWGKIYLTETLKEREPIIIRNEREDIIAIHFRSFSPIVPYKKVKTGEIEEILKDRDEDCEDVGSTEERFKRFVKEKLK